jgi:hypothetical protein
VFAIFFNNNDKLYNNKSFFVPAIKKIKLFFASKTSDSICKNSSARAWTSQQKKKSTTKGEFKLYNEIQGKGTDKVDVRH